MQYSNYLLATARLHATTVFGVGVRQVLKIIYPVLLHFQEQTNQEICSGQQILATVLEVNQYNRSDSLGVNPPLYW